MGLFDMAKKLIGTIPVIGPIIEKGSSFIDMLPKDDDKKTGAFGGLYPQGYQAFKPAERRYTSEIGGDPIGRRGVSQFGPSLSQYRQYVGRYKSADQIFSIARGKAGNIAVGTSSGRVSQVSGGRAKALTSSKTIV